MTRKLRWTHRQAPSDTEPQPPEAHAVQLALLHCSMDSPREGQELVRGTNLVGGWVFHESRDVVAVLVLVNGLLAATVTELQDREDVGEHFPTHPRAATSGWTSTLELGDFDDVEVEVTAYVALAPARSSPKRWGPLLRLASVTCPVVPLHGGYFFEPRSLSSGYTHVRGLAHAPGGVSRVEVYCDGVSAGPARTGLAGTFAGAGGGPGSGLDMFEVSVRVPQGRDRVELTGVGHPCVGEPFALRPWSAQVEPQKPKEWSAAREALVRSRNADRLTALRAALRFATTDAVVPGRLPRVLVVTHDLGLGGGQLYLQELVRRLHRRGLTLSVVSLRGGRLVDELEELGIPVLVTGAADVHDPEAYESHVLQLASWAVEHGSEAALVNTMSAFSGADAAHRIRLPIVWAIHESYPFSQYWTEAHGPGVHPRVVERGAESLAAARCVVFEAEATHRLYVPSIRDGAGVVVPYGVDLSEIADYQRTSDRAAVRRELGFSESTRVLLCMGTVEPRKAQVSLVQAFAGSDRLAGADVRLVFVGGRDGEPYDDVLREAIESYADDRIMLEPVQPHIERWYLAADVLVCASDVESLPRSMLEVMAFGRPIASTSVFGIPELVDDGVTGFLCESRDLLELRRMLERVCGTSADELTALGAAAREVVLRRHDPMIFEEFYLERLTTLAADNELEPSGRL